MIIGLMREYKIGERVRLPVLKLPDRVVHGQWVYIARRATYTEFVEFIKGWAENPIIWPEDKLADAGWKYFYEIHVD